MSDVSDISAFVRLARLTALVLSPDGGRLVATAQGPDAKGARYASALWDIPLDPASPRPPQRLTRSDEGESSAAFRPDGSLLFISSRPEPGATGPDPAGRALWCLPAVGEAYVLARRAGGLDGPVVSAGSGRVLLTGSRLSGSTEADDAERRAVRKDRAISAVLHDGMPVRHWDHVLGEESPRLLVLDADGVPPRDLLPGATHELVEAHYSVTADGRTAVTSWRGRRPGGASPSTVALVDVDTGTRTELAAADGWQFGTPVVSPDGARVAMGQERAGSFARPPDTGLLVMPLGAGEPVRVALGDVHATEWVWSADSATLYVAGDLHGRGAVLAVDPVSGAVRRRLACDAAYTSLCPSPDGTAVYALRSALDHPPRPVRLDATAADQAAVPLPTPAPGPDLPGRLEEVRATGADGVEVHGWLCLPEPAGRPAPVMLWIHGGPFGSWNAWSWRWNPWVAVAQGWAVVLPDPALSTGYGRAWLERAWPYVAAEVFADCETVLDHVLTRPEVDAGRVACLGASFGGYLTTWVAGHVDRFAAIVTHAGLYALDQQHKTTDAAWYKTTVFGDPTEHPEWYEANSPHRGRVGGTPMLVIHGDRDYRVPLGEALRLWWDLVAGWDGAPAELPHRFLELTGENHWVLAPANAEIWYDALLGFCAWHVLGTPWTPSALL